MSYKTLQYEPDGHVVVLTYNRPEQRNAISREMNAELHDAWRRFRDDDDAFVLVITGRPVDAREAERIGLANEVVPEGKALERALELAHEIAELPQGAIRSDKETMVRNVGRTLEEQLRQEAENKISMFARRDSMREGASVAVIESARVGRGVTGNTTAKVSALQSTMYTTIRSRKGEDAAAVYAE